MSALSELEQLAEWFAVEHAGNEVGLDGFTMPQRFRLMVADHLVENPTLGWPNRDEALHYLDMLYPEQAG